MLAKTPGRVYRGCTGKGSCFPSPSRAIERGILRSQGQGNPLWMCPYPCPIWNAPAFFYFACRYRVQAPLRSILGQTFRTHCPLSLCIGCGAETFITQGLGYVLVSIGTLCETVSFAHSFLSNWVSASMALPQLGYAFCISLQLCCLCHDTLRQRVASIAPYKHSACCSWHRPCQYDAYWVLESCRLALQCPCNPPDQSCHVVQFPLTLVWSLVFISS